MEGLVLNSKLNIKRLNGFINRRQVNYILSQAELYSTRVTTKSITIPTFRTLVQEVKGVVCNTMIGKVLDINEGK